ncbi:hypothetical protein Pcinc_007439 [Petrolisthes cinctipes]|uniref:CCHC-type domain-containing protein n=1 Tax=Petrolisthes cinctipes TaxID=88211 RepID=A0AAE1G8K7_PETCI|nr:hypothetical protein Pcinc_007439 [Petrolisthes cinctipes]
MASIDSLVQLGKELGYEGEQLHEFIKYEQNQERERRAEEREKLKLELELEKPRQSSTRHLDRDDELNPSQVLAPVKGLKLPDFDDSRDDLDAYLRCFELFATTAQWPKESWGILLSSHLKGIALEVYARLPDDCAQDYDHVKKALMDRFECTEGGFRLKFRRSRPLKGERVEHFVNRIKNSLKRWVTLSSCDETFDGVINLMLMEQFMNICGRNLQVYLKERSPLPLDDMMELAERFVTAHGGLLNNSRTHSETRSDKQNTQKEGKSHQSGSDTWNKPEKGEHRKMVCFRCDRPGHKAFQYKERKKQAQVSVCKEVGAQKPEPSETVEPDECVHNEALPCGHVVEVVTAIACMPVVRGTVCGAEVTILRDTGCRTIVVRKSLVPASKFTGRNCSVRLANCVVERYPLAQVHIECPYFTGTVNAVCMEEPIYDVLIGNVPGALPLQEMYSTPEAGVSAVATRAAAQKPLQSRKKLKVPDFEAILSVDRKAFQEAQQDDTSLKTWWEFCKEGRSVAHGKGRLLVDKGLLYGTLENRNAQLVVPESRPAVSCADVTAAVVEEEEEEPEQLPLPSLYHKETWRQVKIGETLTGEQQNEIRSVLEEYNEVWSDVPGRTSLLEHKITLIQEQVINAGGFDLVESPELRASCTVICKYVDRSLLAKPSESHHSEISDKNGVKASITKTKFSLKIRCATPQEANKLLTNGVKAFSIFILSHYRELDKWFNIIQCHKCYKYGHETKTCTAPQICFKCSEEGHFYTHCSKSTSTCPNCQGPHTAISVECPSRKHLLKNARLNHSLAHTHPTNTPAQPTYTTTNTPHTSAYSYATAARPPLLPNPRPSPSHSSPTPPPLMEPTSCARMTGCIQAAYLKAGQDFQVFSKLLPEILAYNNLPNIKIPPSWLAQQQPPSPPPTPKAPPPHLPPPPTPSPIPPASQPQTTSSNSPCNGSHDHPPDMSACKRRSTSPSPVRRS